VFTRKFIAIAAGAVLAAGGAVGAVTASAANAGTCVVQGSVTTSPGPQGTSAATSTDAFAFNATTITCEGTSAVSGTWANVTANGNADGTAPGTHETCAEGQGGGNITGGTNTATGVNLTTSPFTFNRVGAAVVVHGTLNTSAGLSATFTAHLSFVPQSGGCFPLGSGPTTASMTGTANIVSTS